MKPPRRRRRKREPPRLVEILDAALAAAGHYPLPCRDCGGHGALVSAWAGAIVCPACNGAGTRQPGERT